MDTKFGDKAKKGYASKLSSFSLELDKDGNSSSKEIKDQKAQEFMESVEQEMASQRLQESLKNKDKSLIGMINDALGVEDKEVEIDKEIEDKQKREGKKQEDTELDL